jgi:thioesterase domain-containing protein/acyl carrier protein
VKRPVKRAEFVAPSTPTEKALAKLWEDQLCEKSIGTRDDYFDLGGDSLGAAELAILITDEFDVPIPLEQFIQITTLGAMAAEIDRRKSGAAPAGPDQGSLVLVKERERPAPFFFVHGGGGNILYLNNLARYLGGKRTLFGLKARGLDGKEPPQERVEDMAESYLAEVRAAQPKGPYSLAGYCIGGVIAFEMAHRLLAAGERVALLAVLDTRVPPLRLPSGELRALPPSPASKPATEEERRAARIQRSFERARREGLTPLDEEFKLVEKVRAAQERARRAYVAKPYPGKLHLIWSAPEEEPAAPLRDGPVLERWKELAGGGLEIFVLPSGHVEMIHEPHVADVARKLTEWLDQAERA